MKTKKTTKTAKTAKKAVSRKSTKSKIAEKNSPVQTLDEILNEAETAFSGFVRNYWILGQTLVKAITLYGAEGKRAFKARFPLTDNAIRNLEFVGRGQLLPQFAMCSDRFVSGLVNMDDSMSWQHRLVGASDNGCVKVRTGDKIVDMKFEEFVSKAAVDAVLSMFSEDAKDPEKLREKMVDLNRQVRARFKKGKRSDYEFSDHEGKKVVRFFRARPWTLDELKKVVEKLELTIEAAKSATAENA